MTECISVVCDDLRCPTDLLSQFCISYKGWYRFADLRGMESLFGVYKEWKCIQNVENRVWECRGYIGNKKKTKLIKWRVREWLPMRDVGLISHHFLAINNENATEFFSLGVFEIARCFLLVFYDVHEGEKNRQSSDERVETNLNTRSTGSAQWKKCNTD